MRRGLTVAPTTSGTVALAVNASRSGDTVLVSDWSSDVCSADLVTAGTLAGSAATSVNLPTVAATNLGAFSDGTTFSVVDAGGLTVTGSEERRVGKACRSRGSPNH